MTIKPEFIKQHTAFTNIICANLPVGVSIYNNDGDLVYVNDRVIEIFGVKDKSYLDGFNIFTDPSTPSWILEKIKNGENADYELVYNFDAITEKYTTSLNGIKMLSVKTIVIRNSKGVIEGYLNICEDITHKRKSAELLAHTNLKFIRLINFMISGVEIYDSNGLLIDCNEYELNIFGLDHKEDLLNQKLSLFNNPNLPAEFTKGLINGEDVRFEMWYDFDLVKEKQYYKTNKKGKIYVEAKGASIISDSNELLGYIVETNDITDKKRQELKLIELHKTFELSLSAGHVSAWNYNIKKRIFVSILGKAIAGDGLTYEQSEAIMHPDDRRLMREAFDDMISGRKERSAFIVRFYDNSYKDYKYYDSEMDVRRDIEGNITDIIGTQRDITDKCLKKLELDNARKSLDMVMESSNLLAWDYDILTQKHHVLYGNSLIEKHSEIVNYQSHTHPDDLIKYNQIIAKLTKGEIDQGKFDVRIKDLKTKTYCSFEHTISSVKNLEGKVIGFIGCMYDMTERNKQKDYLEEQNTKNELIYEVCNILPWEYNPYTHILISTATIPSLAGKKINLETDLESFLYRIHPDDREKAIDCINILNGMKSDTVRVDLQVLLQDKNRYVHVVSDGVAIKDKHGKIIKYGGINRDVDEWIKLNETLNEHNILQKIILNNVNSLLIYSDTKGIIKWDNTELYANLLAEMGIDDFIKDKKCRYKNDNLCRLSGSVCLVSKAVETKTIISKEAHFGNIFATISAIPVFDSNKTVIGVLYKIDDTTESNNRIAFLEEQNKKTQLINAVCKIYFWDYDPYNHTLISQAPNSLFQNKEVNIKENTDVFFAQIHPQDRDKTMNFFENLSLMKFDSSHLETRILYPDMSDYTHIVSDGVAIKDKMGNILKYSGINQNVDEWIKLTETLKEQNITHNIILNNVNSLLFYSDNNGTIKWDNTGSYTDLLLKMNMPDFVKDKKCNFRKDDICQRFGSACLVSEAVKTKQIQSKEVSIGELSVQISAIPVLDEDDNVLGALHKIEDITESQFIKGELIGTKNKLEATNQLLNEIIDKVPRAMYIKDYDDDLKFVRANKIFCDYVGMAENNVIGKTDFQLFKRANASLHVKKDKEVIKSGKMSIYDEKIDAIDGKRFWHVIKSSIRSSDNHLFIIGIGMDITALKESHDKLKTAKERAIQTNLLLNEIINRIPVPMFVIDVNNNLRYTRANTLFAKIVDRDVQALIGKNDYELFSKEVADMHREQDQKLLNGENIITYDRIIERNGVKTYLSVARSLIKTKEGNALIIGILSDTTKLRKINFESEQVKSKADESNKLKSAFLANMSHEIRTPLNAIVGFSELMHSSDDQEDKNEYMKIIDTNNELLLRLINDILDLSKIESGAVDLKPETFDYSPLFDDTFTTLKPRCEKSEVEILSHNPFKKCIVTLDKNRCLQILTNYINNAVKYTQSGYIKIGYDYKEGGLFIFVEDTGIGISEEKKVKLFQRFEKLDNFAQGTGLGLSICKAIAEKMGGKVGAESTEGKGSKFWAWLPCEADIELNNKNSHNVSSAENSKPVSECNAADNSIKNVLVAEDNDSNYMLVKAILKRDHLTRARNGEEAVMFAKQYKYDAILMDMKMPVMGGLEATRKIREFDKETIIVAVTANAFDSDKEEAIKAGCNSFVAKPLKRAELESSIYA